MMVPDDPWSAPAQWHRAWRAEGRERHHRPLPPPSKRPLRLFASNDYLGLSQHPALIAAWQAGAARWGVGAGASALVTGYTTAHADLEAALATWLGFPAARLFTSGYAANLAAVTAFTHAGRVAFFADKLVHASLIDALQLASAAGARVRRYPHRDLATLARWLADCNESLKVIVTDGLFSMDGDLAPLPELAALADAHRAWLIVDDAHGVGVLGDGGRGTFAHYGLTPGRNWLWVATFGKALGVAGAAILGSGDLIGWIDQCARTHCYTTAMPPAQAETVLAAIRIVQDEPDRRAQLMALIRHWRDQIAALLATDELRVTLLPSITPIQPLVVGASERAVRLAAELEKAGFLVPAIRPPTVPEKTARLRVSLSAAHRQNEVNDLIAALGRILSQPQ